MALGVGHQGCLLLAYDVSLVHTALRNRSPVASLQQQEERHHLQVQYINLVRSSSESYRGYMYHIPSPRLWVYAISQATWLQCT